MAKSFFATCRSKPFFFRTSYDFTDGEKTLLVPTSTLRQLLGGKAPKGRLRHKCLKVQRRHKNLPWLKDAILRDIPPPADVHIATARQVERATAGWDHRRHRQKAGIGDIEFEQWFTRSILPDGELRWPFLLLLFGGEAPTGWFIIDKKMAWLHSRRTVSGIAEAAGLSSSTPGLLRWSCGEELFRAARTGKKTLAGPPDGRSCPPKPSNPSLSLRTRLLWSVAAKMLARQTYRCLRKTTIVGYGRQNVRQAPRLRQRSADSLMASCQPRPLIASRQPPVANPDGVLSSRPLMASRQPPAAFIGRPTKCRPS